MCFGGVCIYNSLMTTIKFNRIKVGDTLLIVDDTKLNYFKNGDKVRVISKEVCFVDEYYSYFLLTVKSSGFIGKITDLNSIEKSNQ